MLVDKIGTAAALEQCAEEASALSQASLKMARAMRGENPPDKALEELIDNLAEEAADVMLCLSDLIDYSGLITAENVDSYYMEKANRIKKRFKLSEDIR